MPWRAPVGRTSASITRVSREYGGCSVRKRSSRRSRATHCASTISPAENDEEPTERTFLPDEVGQGGERLVDVGVRSGAVHLVEACRRRRLPQRAGALDVDQDLESRSLAYRRAIRDLLDTSAELVRLRDQGEIPDEVVLRPHPGARLRRPAVGRSERARPGWRARS